MKSEKKHGEALSRLIKIYREYSSARRIDPQSQMCEFWQDPTVEVLVGSKELEALEIEFDIEIDEDDALELYDMNLIEAAAFIDSIIQKQGGRGFGSDSFIDDLTLDEAKQVLKEIWKKDSSDT